MQSVDALQARIAELEQELASLKSSHLCVKCSRPVVAPQIRSASPDKVSAAPRPVSMGSGRPAMPKMGPQPVHVAPPVHPIPGAPPASALPPLVSVLPPPVVQPRGGDRVAVAPQAARRKSLTPDTSGELPPIPPALLHTQSSGGLPTLPPLPLTQMTAEEQRAILSGSSKGSSLSARSLRSSSIAERVAPRSARQDSVGGGDPPSVQGRSPRDSQLLTTEEVDAALFRAEGTMLSATQSRITGDAQAQEALGAFHKLSLSVVSAHGDAKSPWYLVRATVTGPNGVRSVWTLPRHYGAFQSLAKALTGVVATELPKIKGNHSDSERVMVLNAYLMDACAQSSHCCLAMLRFADPFDNPSAVGLRAMQPLHEGPLELSQGKAGAKPQTFHFIIKEHLWYFKGPHDETAAGCISLDYVLVEMVIDSAYPRFSFAICNLQKEPLVVLSTDSTKSLSEWILRIRKAKFLRTGMTYGVAAAAPEEKAAPRDAKTQAAKDLFAAYVSNGTVPSGASLSTIDLNPMKWKPVPDGPDCVVYVEGTLREGTVQKLVEKVLDDQLSSTHFVYTFMATFRYYLKPVEFFPYLLRAWMAVKPAAETQTAQIRVLLILKLWLMYNFCDFCENLDLAKWTLVFFHQHLNSGPHAAVFQKYAAVLVEVMKENALPTPASNAGPNALLPAVFSKEHIEMIDLHPMEIARQLTLYSFGLFAAITPNELMFQRWNSQDKETLCPNVMRMIRRSNTVTMWVQTLILTVETAEARVTMLQRMLEVAWFLLELNNLGSVVEVYSGLQGSAIRRLTDTWDQLSEQATTIWKRLQELCDTSSNFKRYRARLAEAEGPSLPHLGRCLTDLTFSEDGLKTFLEGGRVNVSKCVVIGGVVSEILKRQRVRYTLKPVEAFQSYFQRLEPLSEEALYAKSLLCQPRETK